MKSNYLQSKSEQRKMLLDIAREELRKQEKELCPDCMKNIGYQALAVAFWILHRDFGWGTERLNRLKDHVEDQFNMIENGIPGMATTHYSATAFFSALKKIGVDLEVSQYHD